MRAVLHVAPLKAHEDYEIPPLNEQAPLTRLTRAIAEAMASHPDLQSIRGMQPADCYPDVDFPATDVDMPIDVLLCADREGINLALGRVLPGRPYGVFATSAGVLEPEQMYANRFRIIVSCNEEDLRQHLIEERAVETDPYSSGKDHLFLQSFLNTITHELVHAKWFIEHGNGLSPAQIENYYDAGIYEFNIIDTCSGRGIREGIDAEMSPDEANFIMEEHVEAEGRAWLQWAFTRIEPDLISECLAAYAPTDIDLTYARSYEY